jgi:putative FmdB family regulatory protein
MVMPLYEYRCEECGHEFEAMHRVDSDLPECPECESERVKRRITTAPQVHKGVFAHPGDGKRASKAQLQAKWAEETPKLREKMRAKLGDDAVNNIPSLNMPIGSDD